MVAEIVNDLGGFDDREGRLCKLKASMRKQELDLSSQKNLYEASDWAVQHRRFPMTGHKPIEHFSNRSWVPQALKPFINEELDALGSLFIHRMLANTSRSGNAGFIFDSLGRFMLGLEDCQLVIMTWPSKLTLELGGSSWLLIEWMESLKKDLMDQFLMDVKHFTLRENEMCWIPYGHSCCVAALPTPASDALSNQEYNYNNISFYLTFAYVSQSLWNEVPESTRCMIKGLLVVITMEAYQNSVTAGSV